MAFPKNLRQDRLYRLERVRRRFLRGETAEEIARQMEVSTKQILNDITLIRKEAIRQLTDPERQKEVIAAMLSRAEEMYRTSWEALLASQGESVETRVTSEIDEIEEEYHENGELKRRKKQVPGKPKSTLIRKKQAGDPRWMERAGWAWQKMCELQGLLDQRTKPDTAITAAPTGETGVVLYMPTNNRDQHLQTNTPKASTEPGK